MSNVFQRLLPVLLVLVGLGCTGCGGGQSLPVVTDVIPYTQEQELARSEAANARYKLRDGDVIGISFKYETQLSQNDLIIMPDGYINVKGLDKGVKAAGLSVEELDTSLTANFGEDIRNPALAVLVQEISDPQVYVMGMVKKPGMYKLPWKGTGVMQAVATAGGFQEDANKSQTAILRATDEGFMIRVVDLSSVENIGFTDLSLFDIQPYDIVYVPRSSIGDFRYYTEAIFGSALNVTQFFWDIYALGNLHKIDRIVR